MLLDSDDKRWACNKCEKAFEVPAFVLSDRTGKLVAECPACQYVDIDVTPADFQKEVIHVNGKSTTTEANKAGLSPQQVKPKSVGVPSMTPAVAAAAWSEPLDVITLAEKRAVWLESEEARLEGVIAESKASLAGKRAERRRLEKLLGRSKAA